MYNSLYITKANIIIIIINYLSIYSKTILEIHNLLQVKRGETKFDCYNFSDLSNLINKKINGNSLFDFVFEIYGNNLSSSNLKDMYILNNKVLTVLNRINKNELLGFDFIGFENMKKFYNDNLQTVLIYLNKNKMLLNFINKNFLRQIEFKLHNHLIADIECYKRSLEELGKYLLLKVEPQISFYAEVKKCLLLISEIAEKIKTKVCNLIERQIKDKKLNDIISKNSHDSALNNPTDSSSTFVDNSYSVNSRSSINKNKKGTSIKDNENKEILTEEKNLHIPSRQKISNSIYTDAHAGNNIQNSNNNPNDKAFHSKKNFSWNNNSQEKIKAVDSIIMNKSKLNIPLSSNSSNEIVNIKKNNEEIIVVTSNANSREKNAFENKENLNNNTSFPAQGNKKNKSNNSNNYNMNLNQSIRSKYKI